MFDRKRPSLRPDHAARIAAARGGSQKRALGRGTGRFFPSKEKTPDPPFDRLSCLGRILARFVGGFPETPTPCSSAGAADRAA